MQPAPLWNVSCCISARAFLNSSLPHKPPQTGRHAKSGSQPLPTFTPGIPVCDGISEHRNLSCLRRWFGTEDQRWYIAVYRQVFDCIGPFAGPFCFHDFESCDFYQVFAVIPPGPTTGPHRRCQKRSTPFRLLERFWVSHGSEETLRCSWDNFSPGCQICTFHVTEFRPGFFSTPTQLYLSIFFTVVTVSSARRFCLCIASNQQLQQFPVEFGRGIVKNFRTSVIATCKYWHVLQLNTCQDVYDVLASIVVCIVVCIGGMYWIYGRMYSILTTMYSIHTSLYWYVLCWYYVCLEL